MQEMYLQMKNHCMDLEVNGLPKQGVGQQTQPKEQTHRRVHCLHSPASFPYRAAMHQAFPYKFALQLC